MGRGRKRKLDETWAAVAGMAEAAGEAGLAAAIPQFAKGVAEEDALADGAQRLFDACRALWRAGESRAPGAAAVLVTPAAGGGDAVVAIVNDDMPFLVDSLAEMLNDRGLEIRTLRHPVLTVDRDAAGRRLGLAAEGAEDEEPGPDGRRAWRESYIQIHVDRFASDAARDSLAGDMLSVLADVRCAVRDWKPMLHSVRSAASELRLRGPQKLQRSGAVEETAEFLDWMIAHNFTFLGGRAYTVADDVSQPVAGSGLGLLRDPSFTVFRDAAGDFADWTPEMRDFLETPEPIIILKANRRSTVHRTRHFDFIVVKRYDDHGEVAGAFGFLGLFTSAAYNRSPTNIPLLRGKVGRVIERAGYAPGSHDGKALINVLETHPRDELFQSSEEQLFDQARGVLQLSTRPQSRLFARPDRYGRFVSCLVYVPRERYDSALRSRIGDLLCDAFDGRVADFTPAFRADRMARVHYVIATSKAADLDDVDYDDIERRIADAALDWRDLLRDALTTALGPAEAARLHALYADGFTAGYRESRAPADAVADVLQIDALSEARPAGVNFRRGLDAPRSTARFELYRLGRPEPLSDVIPILENMGFRVIEEQPFAVARGGAQPMAIWLHDFRLETADGSELDLGALRRVLAEGFEAIYQGAADDDRLNRLMAAAGASSRQTSLLRAYSRFLLQARIPYSIAYMEDALAANPTVASDLITLFETKFDPSGPASAAARRKAADAAAARIEAHLELVESLDVDRILRRFLNAINATLRTNYFQPDAAGGPKSYMSFKFDCAALQDLPAPRPWREIFVYAPWVEGVHLRGGPVARGGLRWSDRREDYRTEVLGLVKAQQVKNAVIVPVGSKGGFLPKKLPTEGGRDAVQAEAIRCYRTFLGGLLDVTDNLTEGAVAPPPDVVRWDDDDPYLVVAADKGTATFSDIANEVAAQYGFWLGDAFASGGSNGYDHKAMGITARGAWEAVKRHFRERGLDTQTEPFTVIGVGDMSGDVFGNGMLLSNQIRLLAAFDHRDVFIDPDPDPAASFRERQRLFETPRSTWRDYDPSLISAGGGVFARNAKAVTLTPEIQALTGLTAAKVPPAQLIKALLTAQADLLWFGGVGTYVKDATESPADVGDRANDALRVDAQDVRAHVVGEGANLGVTQAGRIRLARRGARINTDAVDNAAGVDCSDHEVNIKIALGVETASGRLSETDRNALLEQMTDDVAALVLRSNYDQTRALSVIESRAARSLDDHAAFIRAFEAAGDLDRAIEGLPDDKALAERRAAGAGLTRPEISVLTAYAKITLFQQIVSSDLPDDPSLEPILFDYFPTALAEKHGEVVRSHRLRREILATVTANDLVNDFGPTFAALLAERDGVPGAQSAHAYLVARDALELRSLGAEIDALDARIPATVQIDMRASAAMAAATHAAALARRGASGGVSAAVKRLKSGFADIEAALPSLLSPASLARFQARRDALRDAGAPASAATRVAALDHLGGALDIVAAAESLRRPVIDVAQVYFAVGARFGLDWLRHAARQLTPADPWERAALERLTIDLRAQQIGVAAAAMNGAGKGRKSRKTKDGAPANGSAAAEDQALDAVAAWAASHPRAAERAERVFAELRDQGGVSVAQLAVAASQLRDV